VATSPTNAGNPGRQALVLGAGIGGLVAARVLADHFDRVTIVEQDRLPTEPMPRVGVPQSSHVHVLLNSGRGILGRLFPTLANDVVAAGAPVVDGVNDFLWLNPFGWVQRYPSAYRGYAASRPLLEWTIRQQVGRNPRISIVEERAATGLIASRGGQKVLGARIRPRARGGDTAGAEEELRADLVVDATGRGSRATVWLKDLGYPTPANTEINASLGYSSRMYRLADDPGRDWQGLLIQSAPPKVLRGGVLYRLENDHWIATLGGTGKDYPPSDDAGFLEFARSLRSTVMYDAIAAGEPLSPIVATRSTANIWRHYEKLDRWPDGFVVIGDAACAFNPLYGQGMSVAAKEAVILDARLREQRQRHANGDLTGLAERVQKALPTVQRPVWLLATGADLRVPGVEGDVAKRRNRFLTWYFDRVVALTTEDRFAHDVFGRVLNLEAPPTQLFHPRLLAKVLLGPRGTGAATQPPRRQ
jgi:2-polyprenyl-6-methoxyphenol hydroxylase-like FAD-dependent oxidoreductase